MPSAGLPCTNVTTNSLQLTTIHPTSTLYTLTSVFAPIFLRVYHRVLSSRLSAVICCPWTHASDQIQNSWAAHPEPIPCLDPRHYLYHLNPCFHRYFLHNCCHIRLFFHAIAEWWEVALRMNPSRVELLWWSKQQHQHHGYLLLSYLHSLPCLFLFHGTYPVFDW